MQEPPYLQSGDQPPDSPEYPQWTQTGDYVEPTYSDLSAPGVAPAPDAALPALGSQLGETDYARDRFADGGNVDRQIYPGNYHGPAYGELEPRPYPS